MTQFCWPNCITFAGSRPAPLPKPVYRLSDAQLPPALRARCLTLTASLHADNGDLDAALLAGRDAMTAADQAADIALAATTATLLLERSCDRTGFDASLPLAAQVRRRAVRCTDLQVRANIHLTFGRTGGTSRSPSHAHCDISP